jgi:uncharacterized membrane protein YeaQ/YmgE (transglycosylase-associated protein family)
MSIIVAIILGGFVGWAAARLWVSTLFTGSDRSFLAFSWAGLFWSFIGAIILVAIINAFQRPRHHHV